MTRGRIDFVGLSHVLLERADVMVPQWLPGGRHRGHEWVCGSLAGGEGSSCSVNLRTGAWADFASDERGGDLTSLFAAIHNLNNVQAAEQLMAMVGMAPTSAQDTPRRVAQHSTAPVAEVQTPAPDASVPDGTNDPDVPVQPPRPQSAKRERKWVPIAPVPKGTPIPHTYAHWQYGEPVATWRYEFEGEFFGYVLRYLDSRGEKETLPFTWCKDETDPRGSMRWTHKAWQEPRPLYVPAGFLSGDPTNVPVVVVEGEKCAEALFKLLGGEFDVVSWPGGSNAWFKAHWGWLLGRTVYLWPDCDAKHVKLTPAEREAGVDPSTKPLLEANKQPGIKCMVGIGSLLMADQGCDVYMCRIPAPGAVSDGWDVADAIDQGWDAAQVRAFIRGAAKFTPPDDAARAKGKKIDGPADAGDESNDGSKGWRSKLLLSSTGAIKAVRENAVLAMDGMTLPDGTWLVGAPNAQGVIGYNEFTNDIIKLRPTPWGTDAGVWSEVDELKMGEWLVREHWLPSMPRGTLEEAVRMVAYNHRWHPVRKYLESLQWDGVKRLPTWIKRVCMGGELPPDASAGLGRYLARVGTFFVMGMCARVMEPGVKFDYMLILEGAQGMRKSTLLRVLAGEYFADTGLVLGDKDSYQQLQGRWLYEFSELDSFNKSDVTKIKSFIASASDYFRASFDRRARDYPRQVVFGGSTNEDHYLTDPTGNRRFWPVRVKQVIDIDWVAENRDQLFAEAMARLKEGGRMYPTPEEERELFEPEQRQRAVEGGIEMEITKYLYDEDQRVSPTGLNGTLVNEIALVDLLQKIGIGVEKLGPGRWHEKQAAAALRRLGWTETRSSKPGRPRVYRRPADIQKPQVQGQQRSEDDDDCPF